MRRNGQNKEFVIIGSGIAGCFIAFLLAKKGIRVTIFEKYSKSKVLNTSSKRSFSVTFYSRAINLFRKANIYNEIKPLLIKLDGTVAHTFLQKTVFTPYTFGNGEYYTVERSKLIQKFIKLALENPLISIHFGKELVFIDKERKILSILNTKTKTTKNISYDFIIGADGANSKVRQFLQSGDENEIEQKIIPLAWEYKQISIQKKEVESLKLRKNAMHVWSQVDCLLVGFPNYDDSMSMMMTLPKNKFKKLNNPRYVKHFLQTKYPDLHKAHPIMEDAIKNNPIGNLYSIYISRWFYKNSIALVGDAAHAMLPFQGQGMTSAFEDCFSLEQCISKNVTIKEDDLLRYQEQRKRNTDRITELSQENFKRFRHDPSTLYDAIYDAVDLRLAMLSPRFWKMPMYIRIASEHGGFDNMYQENKRQRKVLNFLGVSLLVYILTITLKLKNEYSKV